MVPQAHGRHHSTDLWVSSALFQAKHSSLPQPLGSPQSSSRLRPERLGEVRALSVWDTGNSDWAWARVSPSRPKRGQTLPRRARARFLLSSPLLRLMDLPEQLIPGQLAWVLGMEPRTHPSTHTSIHPSIPPPIYYLQPCRVLEMPEVEDVEVTKQRPCSSVDWSLIWECQSHLGLHFPQSSLSTLDVSISDTKATTSKDGIKLVYTGD